MKQKLFIGPRVRRLREGRGWKLDVCAAKLGLSSSYLSQIETSQRPVTARVLIALTQIFEIDASTLNADDEQRLATDLREATLDSALGQAPVPLSEIRQAAASSPALAKRFLDLHRAYRLLQDRVGAMDEALSLDESAAASAVLPYEEVRDHFHYLDNYVHSLDVAAEALSGALSDTRRDPEYRMERWLRDQHGMRVAPDFDSDGSVLRRFDPTTRTVIIDGGQPAATRAFQLACQVAVLEFDSLIERELLAANLRSPAARNVCRVALVNYAAGALLLPYGEFLEAARTLRHDIERLQQRFQCSFEQVCHRLSNLQRPGQRGVPFYFVRMDMAGNITKRHSATRLQFARFGGACPLWNVHEAFARPGEVLVQMAETPDAARYLCVSMAVVKPSGSYRQPARKYALGLGCELRHAAAVVYADGLDLNSAPDPVGISCRICERKDCRQRAFPALDRTIDVPANVREIVPYRLNEIAP